MARPSVVGSLIFLVLACSSLSAVAEIFFQPENPAVSLAPPLFPPQTAHEVTETRNGTNRVDLGDFGGVGGFNANGTRRVNGSDVTNGTASQPRTTDVGIPRANDTHVFFLVTAPRLDPVSVHVMNVSAGKLCEALGDICMRSIPVRQSSHVHNNITLIQTLYSVELNRTSNASSHARFRDFITANATHLANVTAKALTAQKNVATNLYPRIAVVDIPHFGSLNNTCGGATIQPQCPNTFQCSKNSDCLSMTCLNSRCQDSPTAHRSAAGMTVPSPTVQIGLALLGLAGFFLTTKPL